jgi:predicted DNA-binding transcriptional regulator AlpA
MPKPANSESALGDLFGEDHSPNQAPVKKARKPKARGKPKSAVESPPAPRFLTIDAVAKRYAISHATVWRWVKNDKHFPKPVKLSPGTSRWSESLLLEFENRAVSRQIRKSSNSICQASS